MSSENRAEENELIGRAKKGEFEAFEELVSRTEGKIYNHLLRLVNNPSDAEELLQETYLSAYKNIASFKGNSTFSTWIYRIATNHAFMLFRKRKPELPLDELPLPTHEELKRREIRDWDFDPADAAQSGEVREILTEAIKELPENYRAVVLLRDIEGLSTAETADALGINEGAVKTRLHRTRIFLREILSSHFAPEELEAMEGK